MFKEWCNRGWIGLSRASRQRLQELAVKPVAEARAQFGVRSHLLAGEAVGENVCELTPVILGDAKESAVSQGPESLPRGFFVRALMRGSVNCLNRKRRVSKKARSFERFSRCFIEAADAPVKQPFEGMLSIFRVI